MRTASKIFIIILLLAFLCFLYARYVEPNLLMINHVEIRTSKWRGGQDGLRILQLSDLHLPSMSQTLRKKVINAVEREKPDLIVITGDILSYSEVLEPANAPKLQSEIDTISTYLSRLQAPLGIYMVRGNHDLGDDKEVSDRLVHALRRLGIRVLTTQKEIIDAGGNDLCLLGLDYASHDTATVRYFVVNTEDDNRFLESGPSRKNSYTHFFPDSNPETWENYTVQARLWVSNDQESGAGITFYSQFHDGLDHYYRLRWSPTETYFRFSHHNTSITHGQDEIVVRMIKNRWYWCKVEVSNEATQTRMAARVWDEHEAEPDHWQAVAFDSSARRLTQGTVGFWSIFKGTHRFDDLMVMTAGGDTLLREDWEGSRGTAKPLGWVDFHYEDKALPWLMAGVPRSTFTLLLSHSAEFVKSAAALGVDLMVGGHNHGGQIRIPGLGALSRQLNGNYGSISGLYRFAGTQVYVNRGLGTVFLPMRFLAPPEVTVFHLAPMQ